MKKLKCLLFPQGCSSGLEHIWFMKHACPYCIEKPFERLCNKEYLGKYPANHVMYLGQEKVYICDQHFEMLIDVFMKIGESRKKNVRKDTE